MIFTAERKGEAHEQAEIAACLPQMPRAISNGLIHSAYIKFYTDIERRVSL